MPPHCGVHRRARSKIPLEIGDVTWSEFLPVDDQFDPAACDPDTCINVLFSSGTTGDPKAIPWEHVTPIKAAGDGHWHHDLRAGDVLCWPTSLGWMMGPWLVFAGLLNRATIALYEGGPVEPGFCEFVRDAQVTVLGLVPSIVRGWRRAGCAEGVDWSAIRLFSSTGEASDPDDYTYLMRLGGPEGESRPVIEYCGGSELAGGYVASTLLAPNCPSVFNAKMMGTDFVVLGPSGNPCRPGEVGEVFLIPPAIGMTTRLLNQDNEEVYYAGCPERNGMRLRRHGDLMLVLGDDRYRALGRADDTMNLGGIKTSSAEIEQAVAQDPRSSRGRRGGGAAAQGRAGSARVVRGRAGSSSRRSGRGASACYPRPREPPVPPSRHRDCRCLAADRVEQGPATGASQAIPGRGAGRTACELDGSNPPMSNAMEKS